MGPLHWPASMGLARRPMLHLSLCFAFSAQNQRPCLSPLEPARKPRPELKNCDPCMACSVMRNRIPALSAPSFFFQGAATLDLSQFFSRFRERRAIPQNCRRRPRSSGQARVGPKSRQFPCDSFLANRDSPAE